MSTIITKFQILLFALALWAPGHCYAVGASLKGLKAAKDFHNKNAADLAKERRAVHDEIVRIETNSSEAAQNKAIKGLNDMARDNTKIGLEGVKDVLEGDKQGGADSYTEMVKNHVEATGNYEATGSAMADAHKLDKLRKDEADLDARAKSERAKAVALDKKIKEAAAEKAAREGNAIDKKSRSPDSRNSGSGEFSKEVQRAFDGMDRRH